MKRSKSILSGTMWLPPLLLVCVFVIAGATWARYQVKESQIFHYELKDYEYIYLWQSYDEETASFQGQQSIWQTEDDRKTLDFCVSNGTADNYAKADQRVGIRLLVSLGAWGGIEELDARLNILQTGESFLGNAQPIVEHTPVHSTFGAGWVITFCDEEGEEVGWILDGAKLSYLEGQITVRDVDLQKTTLMQLQVIGDASV